MKKLIFILMLVFFTGTITIAAQETANTVINPLPENGVEPLYPGGNEAFYKKIKRGIKRRHLPSKSGKIIVFFIVEKDGSLTNVKIVQGIEEKIDNRVIKLVSNSIKWTPGYVNDKPVRASYHLPITITVGK